MKNYNSPTRSAKTRRLKPGEYVFRATLVDRRMVQVIAGTFADAVRAAGELTGCRTGDDLLSLEVDVAADRRGVWTGKEVHA